MAHRVLNIPLILGRKDSVDPKFAPNGVVAVARNLRVRKDGRLACRNGYQPLSMEANVGSTIQAYDLHEMNGRLIALGGIAAIGDTFPTDYYEYANPLSPDPWVGGSALATSSVALNPLTNMRQVCGVPQPAGGVTVLDSAVGGGFIGTVHKGASFASCFLLVTKQSDDQVVFSAQLTGPATAFVTARIVYAANRFFICGSLADNSLRMLAFDPVTNVLAPTVSTIVQAASANAVTVFELSAITTPSTGVVIVAYDVVGSSVQIKRYTSAVAQDGATISVVADPVWIDVEADAGANQISLYMVTGTTTGSLRSFNFAGAVLVGSTATASGRRGQLCRLRGYGSGPNRLATVINTETGIAVAQYWATATLTVDASAQVNEAQIATRAVDASTDGNVFGVAFGGWVEPRLTYAGAAFDDTSPPTNALFVCGIVVIHMVSRDLGESSRRLEGMRLGLARDAASGVLLWCSVSSFERSTLDSPTISLLDIYSQKRRQSAAYSGALYFAGATPVIYDGRVATEIGFGEIPGVVSATPSNTASGAMTPLATYTYVQHWEYTFPDGSVSRSPLSAPTTVTMGAADDTVTLAVTNPHSVRTAMGGFVIGASCVRVVSRTVWDAASGTQGSIFRRCYTESIPTGAFVYGSRLNSTDIVSDAVLSTSAPIYTQADRGAFSGPVEENAPEACSYVSASSARLLMAGLARAHEFQESKEAFLGEPINFSRLSNFFGRCGYPINGAVSLDGIRVLFTRDRLYSVSGEGANDIGGGKLPPPVEIPSPGGLLDWRSLLVSSDGIYFQIDGTKLYRLPRSGGSPEWIGVEVQDTLALFPFITDACRVRKDDCVAFACQNADIAGTDARIVVRSLRTGLWTEDSPPLNGGRGIEALAPFGDTLAYTSGGTVFVQSASGFADNASTAIVTQIKTHPIYAFQLGGYGQFVDMLLTGEYRSAGTLALRISYDDGATFVTYDSFTFTGLAVGETIQRKWSIQQYDIVSAVFELTYTPSAAGEGMVLYNAALLVNDEPGRLAELDIGECA